MPSPGLQHALPAASCSRCQGLASKARAGLPIGDFYSSTFKMSK